MLTVYAYLHWMSIIVKKLTGVFSQCSNFVISEIVKMFLLLKCLALTK